MIKDILVNLSYGTSQDGVSNCALSVAEKFGAHIVGTVFAYPVMASGVGLSANFIRVQQAEAQERAESVAAAFDEATRRAGIKLRSRLIAIYMTSGALAGLAAVMSNARFSTTTIGGHAMDNLSTISAVVLGGTSLFGGLGSIAGTVIGVFIPIILLNGFVILGIPPFWQTVAMGAVLILAVWIDQLKRRARERG